MFKDYNRIFADRIEDLKTEGRYRHFAPLERIPGRFPEATYTAANGSQKQVTLWCSNDYLGMGQNPVVMTAMKEAIDLYGAGAGGTRNISGTHRLHTELEISLADLRKSSALVLLAMSPTKGRSARCSNFSATPSYSRMKRTMPR